MILLIAVLVKAVIVFFSFLSLQLLGVFLHHDRFLDGPLACSINSSFLH